MRDLYLVRHGEARSGPSGMDRDFFLTSDGERQANALGRKLRAIGLQPRRIYASRLNRARQTAEILARHVPAEVHIREDLIEHGSAVFLLDCPRDEAARMHPQSLHPDGTLKTSGGPVSGLHWDFAVGGETLKALHERASKAYRALLAAHPEPEGAYIVVAHGSFLAAMVTEALGLALQPVWNVQFAHAGFLHLRLYGQAQRGAMPVVCVHGPNGEFPDGPTRSENVDRNIDNE